MIGVAFNIIGGRYLGENNTTRFNQAFTTSVLLCLFIGVIIELLLLAFGSFVLHSIYGLTGSTLQAATDYLYIGGLTISVNLILFNFLSYFKNIRKTKIFVISFVPASMVNVFLIMCLYMGS
jgi:Na+-driven multidrug efflux pump